MIEAGLFSENGDLPIKDFENSFYKDKEFKNIHFPERILKDKEFYNCNFVNGNFFKSKFQNCEFEKCTFTLCDLSLIIPKESKFIDVTFNKSKLIGVDWELITTLSAPSKFNFYECKIDNCSFHGLILHGIKIIDCSAHGIDFEEADLTKSDFKSTDLLNSRFNGTILHSADLSGATNYNINPNLNKLKKTMFSFPEAASLLNSFDIIIK